MTRLRDVDDDDIYVHSAAQLSSTRVSNPPQNKIAHYPSMPEAHVTAERVVTEDCECVPRITR